MTEPLIDGYIEPERKNRTLRVIYQETLRLKS
jgi:hypothetical protein